jgi:anaerobic ribonucleoside-triphosphate reductase activating protein
MNYMSYINGDDANGTGMRCTLFVSGCEMACFGCHNPESWKLTSGKPYTKEFEDQIIEDLKSPFIEGFSCSGGSPTHPRNYKTVMDLCKRVKDETGKTIWLWTGMTIEELQTDEKRSEMLNYIDVLIEGRFEIDKKDVGLKWRGSSNQKVINIKEL